LVSTIDDLDYELFLNLPALLVSVLHDLFRDEMLNSQAVPLPLLLA